MSDGLIVLFLHDIEKPWRCVLVDGKPLHGSDGRMVIHPEFRDKLARQAFAKRKLLEYGIKLTEQQENAFRYVEGIRDMDYTPSQRVMQPLAALCHTCDLLSARCFYDFPKRGNDSWGAKRMQALSID